MEKPFIEFHKGCILEDDCILAFSETGSLSVGDIKKIIRERDALRVKCQRYEAILKRAVSCRLEADAHEAHAHYFWEVVEAAERALKEEGGGDGNP